MSTQPLTPDQRRIWLAEQFQPGTPANVIARAAALDCGADLAAVRHAFAAAMTRRPALRSRRMARTGHARHRPDPAEFAMPVVDLRHQTEPAEQQALAEILQEEALRSFDLVHQAPIRSRLLLTADQVVVVVAAHRIAIDEQDLDRVLQETCRAGAPDVAAVPVAARPPAAPPASDPASDPSLGALRHWRHVLAGLPPATLPTDRPRSLIPPSIGATRPIEIPAELRAAVRALPAAEPVVLAAAVQALLVRLGASVDAVTTVTAECDEPFVLRTDLSDDPDFATLLHRVCEAWRAAEAHPLPFARLVEQVGPGAADPRHDPFASVALVLAAGPVWPAGLLPGRVGIRYELRFVLAPAGAGGLHGWLEYATDLYDAVTANRIADRYLLLLQAAVAEPRRPLSQLPLVTPAERHYLLTEWNATELTRTEDRCLHELIAVQARLAPAAPAAICGDRVLSYGELERRATRLAQVLRGYQVGPERVVAICAQRSVEMVVGLLAILKAGGAYTPLDPAYPAERLAYMLTDSRAEVVLTDAVSAGRLPVHGRPVVWLDADEELDVAVAADPVDTADPAAAADPVDRSAGPDNLCYVIYTSGSTGRPKGAANEHRGVVNTITGLISRMRIDSSARLLQTSSLSFDMSASDIFCLLLAGGCLVLPEPAEAADPIRLLELVRRHRVTIWSSTPPLLKAALDEVFSSGGTLPDHLRSVVVAGDRVPLAMPGAVAELLPGCRMYNLAGVTEVSITTTAYQIQPEDGQRSSVPWGRPLPNQRMYVLDQYGQPVPPGVPGELYIGGLGVRRGYQGRPELTRERFLPDPFGLGPGARMYRTGDQVRLLSNGELEFLGRLDHQVKVRGFRIELGEVEAEIARHPLIRDAAAAALPDEATDERRLVAYVTFADPERTATVEDLRAFLRIRLPDHMVPTAFVVLPRLPIALTGKIDRTALAALPIPATRPNLATAYVPPRDELERQIVAEWTEILGVDGIGADDDFAALGGHSLLATATMATLSELLGVQLSARDLHEASTPARLAARVRLLAGSPGPD